MSQRYMKLVTNNDDHTLAVVDIDGLTSAEVLQVRYDMAREHNLQTGEARFVVKEAGLDHAIDVLEVPFVW